MKRYLPLLSACPLFDRITADDLMRMLACLRAQIVNFARDQAILHQGDPAGRFGVVLSGCAHIVSSDISGNRAIISAVHASDLFAETFACAGVPSLPVSVVAAEDSALLLLDHSRVIAGCRNGCMAHSILITNLMRIIAQKNLLLNQKLGFVTQRTTRDKLMAYLTAQEKHAGSSCFLIPFDRQALADYLCVERSALSAEIGKLKKAGVIACRKNEFEILLPTLHEQRDQ